jgi:phosphomannomutase
LDGAINFTASHNPAQYHGWEIFERGCGASLPEVTKDIEKAVARIPAKSERRKCSARWAWKDGGGRDRQPEGGISQRLKS